MQGTKSKVKPYSGLKQIAKSKSKPGSAPKSTVPKRTLEKWIRNFRENKDLPIITRSVLVSLGQLKSYIQQVEQLRCQGEKAPDGFRIYFIRYAASEIPRGSKKYYRFTCNKELTQVSLLFVPTINFKSDSKGVSADDCKGVNGEIVGFPLGHPSNIGEGTGLCPPNCGGSFENP